MKLVTGALHAALQPRAGTASSTEKTYDERIADLNAKNERKKTTKEEAKVR